MINSSDVARKNLEKIQDHNKNRIDAIRARIDALRSANLSSIVPERELTQAKIIAERSEALAEKNLADALKHEIKQEKLREERAQEVAAEINAKAKARAEKTYLSAGGTLEEFEAAWPTIRKSLLTDAVSQNAARVIADDAMVPSL
jgi:hypothetical protein